MKQWVEGVVERLLKNLLTGWMRVGEEVFSPPRTPVGVVEPTCVGPG